MIRLVLLTLLAIASTLELTLAEMKCAYGERGSLTATCVNATPVYFKLTSYQFDYLDETLKCLTCNMTHIPYGTFDLSGNRIKNLDLSNSQVQTVDRGAFIGLIFLHDLILANNRIQRIAGETFWGARMVLSLDLGNNSVRELSDDGFLGLGNLETLTLSSNPIADISEGAFNGLTSVKTIDLRHCMVKTLGNAFRLESLRLLKLERNHLEDLSESTLRLPSLVMIDLSYNYIGAIPSDLFANASNLLTVDLTHNQIERIDSGSFNGLNNLETLKLCRNLISEIPQRVFQGLHGLRHLDLSQNNLSTFTTGLFASGLPELRSLDLSHNVIKDIRTTGVFVLPSLHSLDLSFNDITEFDYEKLPLIFPALSTINLAVNWLPCDLKDKINETFRHDNINVKLFEDFHGRCVDYPQLISDMNSHRQSRLRLEEMENEAIDPGSANPWIFSLIAVNLVLVCVLYVLFFRLYKEGLVLGLRPVLARPAGVVNIAATKRGDSQVDLIGAMEAEDVENAGLRE